VNERDSFNPSHSHKNMVYIYKLVDPRNEMVRYVGKTKSQINDRFNDHWCKRYSTKEDATKAYDKKAIKLFGNDAILNF